MSSAAVLLTAHGERQVCVSQAPFWWFVAIELAFNILKNMKVVLFFYIHMHRTLCICSCWRW